PPPPPPVLPGGGSGAAAPAAAEPVRVAEAAGLEHVRAVPEEPQAAAGAVAVQRGPRAGVPEVPGPVREDQSPHPQLPLLRPPAPSGPMPLPAQAGLGQPRRAHRPPAGSLRGERRAARDQPVRGTRREAVPEGSEGRAVKGQGDHLREEEAQEAPFLLIRRQSGSRWRC
ncbi:unnamed protein product, partial [Linum tenue]